jgi:hypothetical protein
LWKYQLKGKVTEMAIQLSTAVRNAMLDAIETTVGTAAKIRILTGSQPATCATAESGTLLVQFTLASDWALMLLLARKPSRRLRERLRPGPERQAIIGSWILLARHAMSRGQSRQQAAAAT